MPENASAERFVERLEAHRSPEQREKYRRYFKLGEGEYGEADERRFDLYVQRAHSRGQMGEPREPDKPDYSWYT